MNIDGLLKKAADLGASDLHITVGIPPMLRLNGVLSKMDQPSVTREDAENICKKLLSEDKVRKFDKNGEVDSTYVIPRLGLFRINCYRQRSAMGVAIRLLSTEILTIEEMELPSAIAEMCRYDRGLILVTGPTGSGKSTTLAAMTDLINSEKEKHVITLEDPIEYYHKHKKSVVTQREIGRDSVSFPGALRASLRQDPDVILIGEMRDLETISIAVTAAETGHLVMATLHTIDAAQTVERIVDSFPPNQQHQIRVQLANSLVGIISQRLVRRKNGKGRIAAVELLKSNPAVRNLIREGKVHQLSSIMQINHKQGMQTLDKHLQMLYEQNVICNESCMENASDKESMTKYLNA